MLEHDLDRRAKLLGIGLHAAGLAAALGVVALAYLLAYRPLERGTAACHRRLDELDELLRGAAEIERSRADLVAAVGEIERRALEVERRVPREPAEAEFLSQVSAAATESGLQVRDYRPGVAKARSDFGQLEVQMSASGTYPALCRFFDRVASLPRLARVSQFEASPAVDEAHSATLSLVVYYGLEKPKPPVRKSKKEPAA